MPIFTKEGSNTANLKGSEFYGKGNSSPNAYRSPAKINWEEQYEKASATGSGATKEQIRKIKTHATNQKDAKNYLDSGKASGTEGENVIQAFAKGEKTLDQS